MAILTQEFKSSCSSVGHSQLTVYRTRRAHRPLFLLLHCLFPSLHHFLPPPPSLLALSSRMKGTSLSCLRPQSSFTSIGRRWLKPLVLAAADEVFDGSSLDSRREEGKWRKRKHQEKEGNKNGRPQRHAAWGLLCLCNDQGKAT